MLYSPKSLTVGAQALFMQGMRQPQVSHIGKLAKLVTTRKPTEPLVFVADLPQLAAHQGETQFHGSDDAVLNAVPEEFSSGTTIQKKHLDDDQVGILRDKIMGGTSTARNHPNKLIIEALEGSTAGYDGVSLFNNSHPAFRDEGTQDNLLAGTGTTLAQFQTDLGSAIAALKGFKRPSGEPFYNQIDSLLITVPPALEEVAHQAVNSKLISNSDNQFPNRFRWDVITESRLTDANDWYLSVQDGMHFPVLFVQHEEGYLDFNANERHDSQEFLRMRAYSYAWYARYVAMPGHWQSAVKTTNA